MSRSLWIALTVCAVIAGSPALSFAAMEYTADLKSLNNSGVTGQAFLLLDGDSLTVMIHASGLEPNQVHPQHIHGLLDSNNQPIKSVFPKLALDADKDGFIELDEGLPAYGPVLLSLTSPPGGNLADFPTAPHGVIYFLQTYTLDATLKAQLLPLDKREIVVHGESVFAGQGANTGLEVDGSAGYKDILPVAAGEIRLVPEPATLSLLALGGLLIRRRR